MRTFLLTLFLSLMAAAVEAATIDCPTQRQTAEITTTPAGWSPIEDTDGFSGREITGSGANLSLVCTYGIAGRIERDPPPGQRVCTVSASGFVCDRPRRLEDLGPPAGTKQITQGDLIDLDVQPAFKPRQSVSLKRGINDLLFRGHAFDGQIASGFEQPGFALQNGSLTASPFLTKRFPPETECQIPETLSRTGLFGPMYDTDRTTLTSALFGCVSSNTGDWYLVRLTQMTRVNNVTRATLTWWLF